MTNSKNRNDIYFIFSALHQTIDRRKQHFFNLKISNQKFASCARTDRIYVYFTFDLSISGWRLYDKIRWLNCKRAMYMKLRSHFRCVMFIFHHCEKKITNTNRWFSVPYSHTDRLLFKMFKARRPRSWYLCRCSS